MHTIQLTKTLPVLQFYQYMAQIHERLKCGNFHKNFHDLQCDEVGEVRRLVSLELLSSLCQLYAPSILSLVQTQHQATTLEEIKAS